MDDYYTYAPWQAFILVDSKRDSLVSLLEICAEVLGGTMSHHFSRLNQAKANFDDIYTSADPRSYFSVLGALDYMIPDVAAPLIRQILAAKSSMHQRTPLVLDVGCSYGINAAVHRFPVSFATLRRRYTRHQVMAVSAEDLEVLDRHYFSSWPDDGVAKFIGLDISKPAVAYARSVGLIEHGITTNLESDPLSGADAAMVRRADVILSTGCIGYVTEKTYDQLLSTLQPSLQPWVISFVLRMFPFDRFAARLADFGLVTEKLTGATFVQRRFLNVEEFENTLSVLSSRGIPTEGFESDGLFQAELFVSRPAADVDTLPLDQLVTVISGRNRPLGTRYVKVASEEGSQIALEA